MATISSVEFAENLRTARQAADLTQVELAERSGVHVSQLRRYEAGVAEPSMAALRRLAVALSVSADELVFGEGRGPTSAVLARSFEAAERLDTDEQQALGVLVEGLVARHEARRRAPGQRRRR